MRAGASRGARRLTVHERGKKAPAAHRDHGGRTRMLSCPKRPRPSAAQLNRKPRLKLFPGVSVNGMTGKDSGMVVLPPSPGSAPRGASHDQRTCGRQQMQQSDRGGERGQPGA